MQEPSAQGTIRKDKEEVSQDSSPGDRDLEQFI